MKDIFVVMLFFIVSETAFGQEREDSLSITTPVESEYITVIEQLAEFPGGMPALYDYVRRNIQMPRGSGGKVYIEFIVLKDGTIPDDSIKAVPLKELIKAGVNTGNVTEKKQFVDEGIRLIKNMPEWVPARSNNKPVKSKFVLPITMMRL